MYNVSCSLLLDNSLKYVVSNPAPSDNTYNITMIKDYNNYYQI